MRVPCCQFIFALIAFDGHLFISDLNDVRVTILFIVATIIVRAGRNPKRQAVIGTAITNLSRLYA